MKNKYFYICLSLFTLTSCLKNAAITYPNFEYQTVYFANQYPIRTLELGEDLFVDNSLDTAHEVEIEATIGGTRDNANNVTISYQVVDSLCNNLYMSGTNTKVIPMPSSYYQLLSDNIVIPQGSILGGVKVKLTDAFFADPAAVQNTYAIPLVMTHIEGADSILQGTSSLDNPDRRIDGDWSVQPKDFVLYVIKFVNKYNGNYLRHGKDVITFQGNTQAFDTVRHTQYVESNEVDGLTTLSLTQTNFPLIYKDAGGNNIYCNLLLNFNSDGTCSVTSGTTGITATGSGKFVSKGEINSWGNQDRDAIYLNYNVTIANKLTASTTDTLVLRDRGVSPAYFTPVIK